MITIQELESLTQETLPFAGDYGFKVEHLGDGKATRHITSSSSFYATNEGEPYKSPPNLVESAANRLNEREIMFRFVSGWNGPVMPEFGKILAEEDIRDIVNYIFDDSTGLSK